MNGAKSLLLVVILILALLPWGFLLVLVNSEEGLAALVPEREEAVDAETIRRSVEERHEKLVARLEAEIDALEAKLAARPEDQREKLDEIRRQLEDEREEKLEALAEVARLQKEYNSALSEVVRLKTERMASPGNTPPRSGQGNRQGPGRSQRQQSAPPEEDTGGWILPPSN
jgi:Skp family chaperone for outer membrane proteins